MDLLRKPVRSAVWMQRENERLGHSTRHVLLRSSPVCIDHDSKEQRYARYGIELVMRGP